MPHLDIRHETGTSHMGSLTPESDGNHAARFKVTEGDMALSSLFVHFASVPEASGTGVAELVIRLDSALGDAYDMTLWTFAELKGVGADVNFRVPRDQLDHFYVNKGDSIVLTQTNPDDGNIKWGVALAFTRRERTDAV